MNIYNHYQKAVVTIGDLNGSSDWKTGLRALCFESFAPHPTHLKINSTTF